MNHLIATGLLILFVLTASCQDLPRITTVIKPEPAHAQKTADLESFMKKRFKKLDFRHVEIIRHAETGTISVTTEIALGRLPFPIEILEEKITKKEGSDE